MANANQNCDQQAALATALQLTRRAPSTSNKNIGERNLINLILSTAEGFFFLLRNLHIQDIRTLMRTSPTLNTSLKTACRGEDPLAYIESRSTNQSHLTLCGPILLDPNDKTISTTQIHEYTHCYSCDIGLCDDCSHTMEYIVFEIPNKVLLHMSPSGTVGHKMVHMLSAMSARLCEECFLKKYTAKELDARYMVNAKMKGRETVLYTRVGTVFDRGYLDKEGLKLKGFVSEIYGDEEE